MTDPTNWPPKVGDLVYDKLYRQVTEIHAVEHDSIARSGCVYRIDGRSLGGTTLATIDHLTPFSEFIKEGS